MAKEKDKSKKPKKPILKKKESAKKQQTVRERAAAAKVEKPKRRIKKATGTASKQVSKARSFGKKEYHLPLPDNKAGRVLKKRVRILPRFVTEAFKEIRQVTWPDRKNTIRLTIAVLVFAVVISSFVGALDYVFGELFERFIVNENR